MRTEPLTSGPSGLIGTTFTILISMFFGLSGEKAIPWVKNALLACGNPPAGVSSCLITLKKELPTGAFTNGF
jgi:hypothetical protein